MTSTPINRRRDGAILLIVLVLLALFAVIGLTFVLYSQSEAVNSRIHREAMIDTGDTPDPTAAINAFYAQLLFPVQDIGTGITSALRGHSLAQTLYGYNPRAYATLPDGTNNPDTLNANGVTNKAPYSGVGNFKENIPGVGLGRFQVINYTGNNSNDNIADPEFTHPAARTAQNVYNGVLSAGTFVPKNAPYTYPDRNNAFLAMMDPATGKVVMPSFHRPNLFGTLASNNPNWTNTQGRYMLLRPRPYDHVFNSQDGRGSVSDFPYPPANPDGTITGDVQNYRWGNSTQQNDSVWLHANLPTVKWRGRDLQPLIAPLIIPLDGRINLGVAGNLSNSGSHTSQNGFGVYEINPTKLVPGLATAGYNLTTDVQQIITYRNNGNSKPISAAKQSLANANYFTNPLPGQPLETLNDWMPINWDTISPNRVPNPPTVGFQTDPNFPITGWDNNNFGANHHSLYNPYFEMEAATAGVGGRALKMLDLRQTGYRYSGKSNLYNPPLYGLSTPNNSFSGSAPNHPSNTLRALTTPVSNNLNYAGATAVGATNLAVNAATAFNPASPTAVVAPFNPAALPGLDSVDKAMNPSNNQYPNGYRSALAALGPVNLNRSLADYRTNTSLPLAHTTNVTAMPSQAPFADRDRQIFCRDIFVRLVLATGAPHDGVDFTTGWLKPFTAATTSNANSMNILRYLAQISVNIVDQIDNDDISTAFVWNPVPNGFLTPWYDPANFNLPPNPDHMGLHTVFGVEKTRLVLNEVYSEVINDPNDSGLSSHQANSPSFHVRFFIEVLNPLNATVARSGMPAVTADTQSPMGGGKADLYVGSNSVYRFQIYTDSSIVRNDLFSGPNASSNVSGAITTIPQPKLQVVLPQNTAAVEPNDAQASNIGFRQLIPQNDPNKPPPPPDPVAYALPPVGGQVIGIPYDPAGFKQLHYTVPAVKPANAPPVMSPDNITTTTMAQLNPGGQGQHAVVMQRLMNPYLSPSPSNPWITVDTMQDILVNDAVRYGQAVRTVPPPIIAGDRAQGTPDPNANQQRSHSRRAPMYAFRNPTAGPSTKATFAVDQQRSMLRHNGTDARYPLAQPFEWMTHLDRKLINNSELLSVSAVKPHEQLHYFATTTNGTVNGPLNVPPTDKQKQLTPWTSPQANLYRALSALDVKPFMYGIPTGGRQPGKVNANAVWHADVINAVLDSNGGNAFTSADVNTLWTSVLTGPTIGRTPNFPNVNDTLDEGGTDRPINSLAGAGTIQDSLLRPDTASANPNIPVVLLPNSTAPHHYIKEEMLRKLTNNVGTTSDTFLVLFTIGYFEIRSPATGNRYMPYLGREAFAEIPGDLRVQYGSIVDRSMMGTEPVIGSTNAPVIPPLTLTTLPSNLFVTELASPFDPMQTGSAQVPYTDIAIRCQGGDASGLRIDYEGRTYYIRKTGVTLQSNEVNTIVLGSGSAKLVLPINGIGPNSYTFIGPGPGTNGDGIGKIRIPQGGIPGVSPSRGIAPLGRDFPAGTMVSNVELGNPGPQPAFDVNAPAAKLLIRDLQKLR